MKKVLVTGGMGYVGSHCCISLIKSGFDVLIVDDLSKSRKTTLNCIEKITNKKIKFKKVSVNDIQDLIDVFNSYKPDSVVHTAGLKSVSESQLIPNDYYMTNVMGTINLLKAMEVTGCKKIVFSSSATVYGRPEKCPINESHELNPENVYGKTKLFAEEIIKDWVLSSNDRAAISLRYFNPIGAHKSGLIYDNPLISPSNILPVICRVAAGKQEYLKIYGDDYNTRDGTGERDYIHIMDVSSAHSCAIMSMPSSGFESINLSTGKGTTVIELVDLFEKLNDVTIKKIITKRRDGDVASSYSDNKKAKSFLSWNPEHNLDEMLISAFKPYLKEIES